MAVYRGVFSVGDERSVAGELILRRKSSKKSKLRLWDTSPFDVSPNKTIHGIVSDGSGSKAVSVFHGLVVRWTDGFGRSLHTKDVIFSTVTMGAERLELHEKIIRSAGFAFDEIKTAFRNTEAFSVIFGPDSDLREQVERSTKRKLREDAVVAYFNGDQRDLNILDTALGDIEINARGVTGHLGPDGIPLRQDGPYMLLKFSSPLDLGEARRRVFIFRCFVGLLIGYVPALTDFYVRLSPTDELPDYGHKIQVYSHHSTNKIPKRSLQSALLDFKNEMEFTEVTKKWLMRNQEKERHDANLRFLAHFGATKYNEDRLISGVNMFDLLPQGDKLYANGKEMRDIKNVIKRKAEPIVDTLGENMLPSLDEIIEHAVDGRNHYVHGNAAKLDFRRGRILIFLINTLEFVFGVSEMLECGWDMRWWLTQARGQDHTFGDYLRSYRELLQEVKNSTI